MEQAKALYESAKEEYERAKKRLKQGDGQDLRHATELKNFMFETYRLAIQDFNGYVLDAKLPDDADG